MVERPDSPLELTAGRCRGRLLGGDGLGHLVQERPGGDPGARILGHSPGHRVGVEGLGLVFVDEIAGPHGGLHPEQVLGVAQVVLKVGGHLVEVLEQPGEDLPPSLDYGIVRVDHVEGGSAVEGVHHHLDGVAHIVEPLAQPAVRRQVAHVRSLAVGIPVAGGVGVHDVEHPPVGDHRIGIGVQLQERGQVLHSEAQIPIEDDPGIVLNETGDQRVDVAKAQGECRLAEEAPDAHTVLTVVFEGNGLVVLGVVHLGNRGPDDGVAGEVLAYVELGPGELEVGAGLHRDVANHKIRRALGGNRVHRRHRHAVAMGVLDVTTLPRLLGDVGHVELAGADHHLGYLVVDHIAVHIDFAVEGIKRALGLLHLEGVGHHIGIQKPNIAHTGTGCQLLGGDRGVETKLAGVDVVLGVLVTGNFVESQGVAGGLNVARDVLRLFLGLLRLNLESLDDGGIDRAHDDGHHHPQAHRGHRQHPAPLPDVDNQQDGGQHRDQQQQVDGGQLGVDVGEGGAVHRSPRGEVEAKPVVVVAHGPNQGDQRQQNRQVNLHLRSHPLPGGLHPDAAVHVMGDGGDDGHNDEGSEEPAD